MQYQYPDVAGMPLASAVPLAQRLNDVFYCYPGAGNWLSRGNFSHQVLADSGNNLYNLYNNMFEIPYELNITVSG